ncbi:MAG: hypothetical protein ACJ75L_07485 [Gaiellaceae bacterium]
MDDTRTRAQLVASDHAGTIGTVVTRTEVADAATGTEFPATLLLDLDRVETAEDGEVTAHARLAVDWDRDTLERVLASTDDEKIGLWFDERELAQAFDEAEVEAHGFREKAAVIAVAVTAAGASATPALASRVAGNEGGGGGTPAAAAAAAAQPMGAERGLQQDEQLGAPRATAGFNVAPGASGQGPVVQPAGAERALLQDEQAAVTRSEPSSTAVTSTGDATLSSGELAAAVAGGALLIAAAGFGAARRRTPPAQPA